VEHIQVSSQYLPLRVTPDLNWGHFAVVDLDGDTLLGIEPAAHTYIKGHRSTCGEGLWTELGALMCMSGTD